MYNDKLIGFRDLINSFLLSEFGLIIVYEYIYMQII